MTSCIEMTESMLNEMGVGNCCLDHWRLFVESSQRGLKYILLAIGNKIGPIPIAHAVKAKEACGCVKRVLQLLSYDQNN